MKEKAKLTSQEHQNVSVNSVQTKKELAEVESLITQGMNFCNKSYLFFKFQLTIYIDMISKQDVYVFSYRNERVQ